MNLLYKSNRHHIEQKVSLAKSFNHLFNISRFQTINHIPHHRINLPLLDINNRRHEGLIVKIGRLQQDSLQIFLLYKLLLFYHVVDLFDGLIPPSIGVLLVLVGVSLENEEWVLSASSKIIKLLQVDLVHTHPCVFLNEHMVTPLDLNNKIEPRTRPELKLLLTLTLPQSPQTAQSSQHQ